MSVLRFDPFRGFDRMTEQMYAGRARSIPVDVYRRGDQFWVHLDLPGVATDAIEMTVDQNVLTIKAERRFEPEEGDELLRSVRVCAAFFGADYQQVLRQGSDDSYPRQVSFAS